MIFGIRYRRLLSPLYRIQAVLLNDVVVFLDSMWKILRLTSKDAIKCGLELQ